MIKRLLFTAAVLALLFFVLRKSVDWQEAQRFLWNFPKPQLALFLTLSTIITSIKSYRFFRILRDSNINIDFPTAFKTYFAGGATSPLPAGEMLRSSLLKKEGDFRLRLTMGPVLMQAYMEVLSAVLIVIAGSLFFEIFLIPALLSLILLVSTFLIISHDKPLQLLIKKTIKFKKIYDWLRRIKKSQGIFKKTFLLKEKLIPNLTFVNSLLVSLITHLLGGLLLFLIIRSAGGDLNYLQSLFIYALGIVVSSIGSISPGGLGFTEGAMTAGLIFFAISLPQAIMIVILFRLVTLVFNIFLGIIFLAIFYRSMLLKY